MECLMIEFDSRALLREGIGAAIHNSITSIARW